MNILLPSPVERPSMVSSVSSVPSVVKLFRALECHLAGPFDSEPAKADLIASPQQFRVSFNDGSAFHT